MNFTLLTEPVTLGDARERERALRQAESDLEARYPEQTLYFPFGFSDTRELRAQQTYFVKMPREVLEILSLDELGDAPARGSPEQGQIAKETRQRAHRRLCGSDGNRVASCEPGD